MHRVLGINSPASLGQLAGGIPVQSKLSSTHLGTFARVCSRKIFQQLEKWVSG